jgi:hypothetical protein
MSLYEDRDIHRGSAHIRRVSEGEAFRLMVNIVKANKDISCTDARSKWESELSEEMMEEVLAYTSRNYWAAAQRGKEEARGEAREEGGARDAHEAKAHKEEARGAAAAAATAMQVTVLKSLVMPGGKTAWDSTCGEVARVGGFLGAVGKLGAPTDLVRDIPADLLLTVPF